MKHQIMPACYHPTTVVFVDDDRNYLTGLSVDLDVSKFSFKMIYEPVEAIEILRKYKPNLFTARSIKRPEENLFDHRNIDINVGRIWREIYNPYRFSEISVVVVDYAMPGMDGISFASKIRLLQNAPFKILLLTGEASAEKAVAAFNDKVIDKFVRKDAPNFEDVLNEAICELQKEYFLALSQLIMDSLVKNPEHPIVTWLDEPAFFNLFDQICKKHQIVEYYLTDVLGSFMFLDFEGNPSWLAVKNDEEMRAAYEVAESSGAEFPPELLKAMYDRKKILYLHGQSISVSDNPEEVQSGLHHAIELKGNKANYYYAYIDTPNAYDIDREMVLSYRAYRDQLAE